MIWLLVIIIIGFLIFGDLALLGYIGLGVLMVTIPILVFFAVWGGVILVTYQLNEQLLLPGVIVGFIAGVYIARKLVAKVLGQG
jgi:uncharacterized protein YneF (UPF0154 family)